MSDVVCICGGLAACGPSALLANKKGLIRNKDMPFGNPPYHGTKNAESLKNRFIFIFYLYGSKSGGLGQKTVFLSVLEWV